MSKSDQNMEEVLRKIEELSAGMEPPELGEGSKGEDPKELDTKDTPVLDPKAFDELQKQASESTNVLVTIEGLLESINSELVTLNTFMKDAMG